MFTGLIENKGRIIAVSPSDEGGTIHIECEPWDRPVKLGDSIAVQGVCLTVARIEGRELLFNVLAETFHRTNLASKQVGQLLNLEPALRAGDPLGGHIVNGHVDGVGHMKAIIPKGQDRLLEITADESLLRDMVYKGSVAVDGISLTIAALGPESFHVHIIPYTWEHTSLQDLDVGDPVNLETDILAKYVRRAMEEGSFPRTPTWNELREQGWADPP